MRKSPSKAEAFIKNASKFKRNSFRSVSKILGISTTIFPKKPDSRNYNFRKTVTDPSDTQAEKKSTNEENHIVSLFPKNGLRLSSVFKFIDLCGGESQFVGLCTAEVNTAYLMPITCHQRVSYCDYLKHSNPSTPDVGPAQVFISHAWQYMFLDVVEALKSHFRGNEDIIIWFDLFSNNQHSSSNFDIWSGTFKTAIAQIGHTVLILAPWNDPIPLRRAWCLYELFCTVETESKFQVAMSVSEQNSFIQCILTDFDAINKMLATIDAENSQCRLMEDRMKIFDAVRNTVGFGYINGVVFEQLREWVIATVLVAISNATDEDTVINLKAALGNLYLGQARLIEARPYLTEVFDYRRNKFGESDPKTLSAAQSLANLLEEEGREEEALQLYSYCLDGLCTLSETDLEQAAMNYYNLCAYVSERGNMGPNAENFLVKCITACQHKYGPNHVETLAAMHNLSNVYRNQLKFAEAQQLLSQCLETSTQVMGADHPDTLSCMDSLGNVYKAMGQWEEALTLLKTVYNKRKVKLGDLHPSTLLTQDSLGNLYALTKQFDLALPLLEESLSVRTLRLGENHQDTLHCLYNLASYHEAMNNVEISIELFFKCLQGCISSLGYMNYLTMSCQTSLANLYYMSKKYEQSVTLYNDCLRNKKAILGITDRSTLLCLNNLCVVLRANNRRNEAKSIYSNYISECIEVLGEEDLAVSELRTKMNSF